MKKQFNLLVLLFTLTLVVSAQNDTLYIHQGANVSKYAVNEIDSMVFYNTGMLVEDIDGNVYRTTVIGDQIWFAENLRVTADTAGNPLPYLEQDVDWSVADAAGYCWYNDNEFEGDSGDYANTYGLLYNWYAVEEDNICPSGWRVANNEDWIALEIHLGMSQEDAETEGEWRGSIAPKLAGFSSLWCDDILIADPDFGLSGLNLVPSGYRQNSGSFKGVGERNRLWTVDEVDDTDGFYVEVRCNRANNATRRSDDDKKYGYSVRCVKK